jgi:glycosyltransferase involved in cell wall biosynthesis
MRVLVAHNFYQQPGGEDQCFAAEVAMLKGHGHEVTQYCLHNDAIEAMSRFEAASRTVWNWSAFREIQRVLSSFQPQIVHFHNTFPLISPAAYYAARGAKVRVVQTLHNFRLYCSNSLFFRNGAVCEDCLGRTVPWPGIVHKCYRGSRAATAAVVAMLTAHRALGTWKNVVDVYIALTEFSRQKLIEGCLPPEKIVVKSNVIARDPGTGDGLGGYAVFVGRLSEEKGLQTLVEAWKVLPDRVPLKIVGDGPLSATVKDAAANDSRIEWLGRKSAQEVDALLGDALFLVVPSQCYENFPRVVVEAFAKGTPVIASDFGAMAELVDHGRTGLRFAPGDAVGLASAVQHLADQPWKLKCLREAARREYEQKYTEQSNYRTLMAIYEQALGHSRPEGLAAARRVVANANDKQELQPSKRLIEQGVKCNPARSPRP